MGRPTETITLYLNDGTAITATIKTPKLKLVSKVRQLSVKAQFAAEQRASLYQKSNALNDAYGQAEIELEAATESGDAAKIAAATAAFKEAEDACTLLLTKIESKDQENMDVLIEQVQAIVNLPNDDSSSPSRPRTLDEIDWESSDLEDIKGAINFFSNGTKS